MKKNELEVMDGDVDDSRPVGRPSKFQPEHTERVFRLCLLGLKDEELAECFGVDVSTLSRWKVAHPDFREAVQQGKLEADAAVAEGLYRKACAGDVRAAEFWLRNRQRDKWCDRQRIDVSTESKSAQREVKSIHEIPTDELMRLTAELSSKAAELFYVDEETENE